MQKTIRTIAFLLAIVGAHAACAAEAIGDPRTLYTPGYFLDQVKFDGDAHRYYHDYAMEKAAGVTPSISPYIPDGDTILNWTNFNSRTFTVTDAGRYVEAWTFYTHGAQSYQKAYVTGHPKSYTVTWDFLAGLENKPLAVDLIPLLKMITYTLEYDANGGSWNEPQETWTYIWSNAVTVASASVISRTGYTFQDWNTKSNGTGIAVAAGLVMTNASGGSQLKVTENNQEVTLYAQWKANKYPLTLVPGTGIEKICYAADGDGTPSLPGGTPSLSGGTPSLPGGMASLRWHETAVSTNVPVDYASTWYAYAVAKLGYTYADYTALKPNSGVMGLNGAYYGPVAAPNAIRVDYDGNGATSGSTPSSSFTYDKEGFLEKNGFSRTYTVTFNGNASGASVDPSYAVATYTFTGWATSSVDAVSHRVSYTDGQAVTNLSTGADVRLYALWRAGSVDLPHATRPGYAFLGWYADKACRYKVGDAGGSYTPTKNVTLYAKWQASANVLRLQFGAGIARIYYRVGDATAWTPVRGDTSVTLAYGTKWQAYAVAASGYTYTTYTRDRPRSDTIRGEDAVFRPEASAKTYVVTYDGNGKTSGSTSTSRLTCGETGKLSDNTFERSYRVNFCVKGSGASVDPTLQDVEYTFAGWNTEPDGSGTAYANQAEVQDLSLGAGVTLYAQWTASSVILPEPKWEGHAFLGWYADAEGRFKVGDAGSAYTPTKNVTLYAQWDSLDYALTLQVGGGIEKICYATDGDGTPSLPGGTASRSWTETTVSTNVVLDYGTKWYAYATAKPGYTHTATSETRPKSGTMTVEGAVFAPEATANTITVTYVGNGSTSGSTSSSRFTYDTPGVLTDNGFVRSYRVNFNVNGAGGTVSPTSAEGTYAFTSWNSEADGSGESYTNQATVLNLSTGEDVRLYAQWTNETAAVILPEPVRQGHAFEGWYAEAGCTNLVGNAGEAFIPTANTTLYPKWTVVAYQLTLQIGGGIEKICYATDGGGTPSLPGGTASLQWIETSVSTNVVLDYGTKWYAYATAKPGYTHTATSETRPKSGTMTVEGAVFAPEATANTITVTYVGNGSTSGSTSSSRFTYDTPGVLTDNGFVRSYRVNFNVNGAGGTVSPTSAEGTYAFTSWNSEADGSGESYTNQATVLNLSTGEDVRLYAQWTNETAVIDLPYPTLPGAIFAGWYADKDCTEFVGKAGDFYLPTCNITLYAKWVTETFTVTFVDGYAGPGSVPGSVIKIEAVPCGGRATAPTPPAHVGYKFSSWSGGDVSAPITSDTTFSAQYAALGYHVTYHANYPDGTDTKADSAGCGPGSELGVDSLKLLDVGDAGLGWTKPGYRFLGWSWSKDAATNAWSAGSAMAWNVINERTDANNEAALYAVWEPITYTVVYEPGFELQPGDYDGGPTNQTLTYDRPDRLLANPYTLDHQRFLGWSLSPVDAESLRVLPDQSLVSNLTTTAGATITLTAVWDGNGDHTVVFDGNGATNGTMDAQTFRGSTEEYLSSNCFSRVGYTFAGWSDQTNAPSSWTDRQSYAFADSPRHSTNTLYAVWEPISYTIIFNTGMNGVFGTIQPTNCLYDQEVALPWKIYRNQYSCGFCGWRAADGRFIDGTDQDTDPKATNLCEVDGDNITLYAVWKDIGDLSRAVGLTNAALVAEKANKTQLSSSELWTNGVACVLAKQCIEVPGYGDNGDLHMTVFGKGSVSFGYKYDKKVTTFGFIVDGVERKLTDALAENKWVSISTNIDTEGMHDIRWRVRCDATQINTLALNNIRWIPDDPTSPEDDRTYELKYRETHGASLAGLPTNYVYKVGVEGFKDLVSSSAADGDGTPSLPGFATASKKYSFVSNGVTYTFAGWSPAKIDKFTTGDITVTARWTEQKTPAKVTFKYDKGLGRDGVPSPSASWSQMVTNSVGDDVLLPTNGVDFAADPGYRFVGWYDESSNLVTRSSVRVTDDTNLTARAELITYRIDYEGVPSGVVNTNRLGFTANDLPVTVGALDATRELHFAGWTRVGRDGVPSPSAPYEITNAENVTLQATWLNRVWHTVTFVLGDHLARTGGGALVQEVEDGQCVESIPSLQLDEGYRFVGWTDADGSTVDPAELKVKRDETLTALTRAATYPLSISGAGGVYYSYGAVVTNTAPFDVRREGQTNVVCVGWTGSGCVPGSGGATQVVFTVTGAGTLTWQYETNVCDIVVRYDGNGATSGSTRPSYFFIDTPGDLRECGFTRQNRIRFDANGGKVDPDVADSPMAFTSWNTASDGSGTTYAGGARNVTFSTPDDVTLFAQWTTNGSSRIGLPEPVREEATFCGWKDPQSGLVYNAGDFFVPISNTTLVAQWNVKLYSLTLTVNTGIEKICYAADGDGTPSLPGGTASLSWTETTVSTNIVLAYGTKWSAYATAKPGYTYTATSEASPMSGQIQAGGSTFSPQATANAIPVFYDGNGATSGKMKKSSFTYDQPGNLTPNAFERIYTVTFDAAGGVITNAAGAAAQSAVTNGVYAFVGWATNTVDAESLRVSYADGQTVTNLSTGTAVTLYAVWTTNEASVVILPAPTREGYDFTGWEDAVSHRVYKAGDFFVPISNTTLVAQWSVRTYTLSLVMPERGIEKIFYAADGDGTPSLPGGTASLQWIETSVSTNVVLNFGTKWSAYATAKPGYTHTATSAERPQSGTMQGDSRFAPVATANTIPVVYDGNGATSGKMDESSFTYDEPGNLASNGYLRVHKLTYNAMGGAVTNASGTVIDPALTNFVSTFMGWATNTVDAESLRVSYGDGQAVTNLSTGAAVTLYAVWKTNEASIVILPLPKREQNNFLGWYAEESCLNKVGDAGEEFAVTNTATLYAKWEAQAGTLSLTPGTGIGRIYYATASQWQWQVTEVATNLALGAGVKWQAYAVAKPGYTTNETCSASGVISDKSGTPFNPSATANAIPVVYDGNGATGGKMEGSSFTYDQPGNLTPNAFERIYTVTFDAAGGVVTNAAGAAAQSAETNGVYAFVGWATNTVDAESLRVSYADGQTVTNLSTGADVRLYAVWTTNAASVVTLPAPTREGYDFTGWKDAVSHRVYEAGDRFVPNSDTTLRATWTPISYSVRFEANGGSGSMSDQTMTYDTPAKLSKNAFAREYMQFVGWKDEAGQRYDDEQTVLNLTATAGAYVVLTAQWETKGARYIRYDKNGGDGEMAVQTVYGSASLTSNAFTRVGYSFTGWATNETAAATYSDGATYSFSSETPFNVTNTLYAAWRAIQYTIDFDKGAEDVLGALPSQQATYDATNFLPNCEYGGFTNLMSQGFLGWSTEKDGAVIATNDGVSATCPLMTNLTSVAGEQVTLYAVWRKGLGDLSDAVGLTNAVLKATADATVSANWKAVTNFSDHESCVRFVVSKPCSIATDNSPRLSMLILGDGVIRGEYYTPQRDEIYYLWDIWCGKTNILLTVNGSDASVGWKRYAVHVDGAGIHEICWAVQGSFATSCAFALDNITWTPGGAKNEELALTLGTGIAAISYATGEVTNSAQWIETVYSTNVILDVGTRWFAYATARPGYSYTETSQIQPTNDVLITSAAFCPQAKANTIPVTYDGNRATGGEMVGSSFTYDMPTNLPVNAYTRIYTVTFDAAGGVVTNAAGAAAQSAVTNGVYAFVGWATNTVDAESLRVSYADGQTVTNLSTGAAVKLYAVWTTNEASVVILPEPTREGYDFTGWEDAVSHRVYKAGDFFVPISNTKFVAQWSVRTYTLSLVMPERGIEKICYAADGDGTPSLPGGTATLQRIETSVSTNVVLNFGTKWFAYATAKPGYTHTETSAEHPQSGTMQGDSRFAPVATANTIPVVYDGNGATSGKMDDSSFTYDEPGNLTSNGYLRVHTLTYNAMGGAVTNASGTVIEPAQTNFVYTFMGWATNTVDAESLRVSYGDGQAVTNLSTGAKVTLYAQWTIAAPTVVVLPLPKREQNNFLGWYAEESCLNKVGDAGSEFTVTNTATLYAKWEAQAGTLSLTLGTGIAKIYYKTASDWQVTEVATNLALGAGVEWQAYAVAKPGYTTNETCSASGVISDKSSTPFHPSATANAIPVVYDGNGATGGAMTGSSFTYDMPTNLPVNAYTRIYTVTFDAAGGVVTNAAGAAAQSAETNGVYAFVGWATNTVDAESLRVSYADGQAVTNLSTGAAVKLYAVWTTNAASVVILPAPTREGYDFNGWKDAVSHRVYEAGDRFVPNSDTTLRATWTPISYSVRFEANEGSGTMSDQTMTYDVSAKLTKNVFTQEHKQFVGWKDESGRRYDDEQTVSNLTATAGARVVLTAQWEGARYIRYDKNGGEGEMAVQTVYGFASLTSNAFTRVGYSFTGWATNETAAATYSDGATYSFEGVPVGTTNTLYAAWRAIQYTIDFDKGAEGVLGALLPQQATYDATNFLPNCEYGGFTNLMSQGFLGWSTEKDGAVMATNDGASATCPLTTNLTSVAGEQVTLYAVWRKGLGDLSDAVGLTNAVLKATADAEKDVNWERRSQETEEGWDCGHANYVRLINNSDNDQTQIKANESPLQLSMKVDGPGTIAFEIFYCTSLNVSRPTVTVVDTYTQNGRDESTNLVSISSVKSKPLKWSPYEVSISGAGIHEIRWLVDGRICRPTPNNIIALDNITWTPDEKNAPAEAEEDSAPRPAPKFALMRVAGAAAPSFALMAVKEEEVGPSNCWVSVTAGEGGSVRVLDPSGGVCDVNEFYAPTGVVLTAEAKAAPGWRFVGWESDAVEDESPTIAFTVEGPVALKAIFARTFTVTFELGDHLVQTGTVMLVQTVVANGFATAPGFIVDEGCTFKGWRASDETVERDKLPAVVRDVTYVAEVSVSQHELALGTNSVTAAYGDVVTAVAPFDEVTTDGMCVTCVGWTGSGCVPPSGGATQVVFTVTGAGTLTWLYETNCWVSVRASDPVRGAVAVLDPAGGVCPTNEFWAPVGAELTALAQVNAGYVFSGWWCEGALVSRLLSLALVVPASDLAYEARFEDPAKPKYDVTFKLGDHLSRTGGGEREQSVEEGQSAAIPEVEVEEKWCFAGWHVDQTSAPRTDIDKAGYLVDEEGLRVMKGEVPNIAGAMTLSGVATAKVYKVAFDVDVSVAEGCEWMGSVTGSKTSVKVGTTVTIKATAKTPYVFAGWYDGPFVEPDAEPISQAASYSFTMPEKDVAYVAKFIAKSEDWAKIEVGEVADEYKRGVAIAPIAVTATGGSLPTVKVSGLPTGLKFTAKDIVDAKTKVVTVPANTIYGTPTKSGVFTTTVTATTVGKATATTSITFVVRALGEHVVTAAVCDGAGAAAPARGKVTGPGVYAAGKKVTLKATAAKNYVFSGWYGAAGVDALPSEAASLVSRLSSLALTMPSHDLAYEARFITAAEDAKSVQAGVNGLALIVDGKPVAIAPATNVTAGVYLVWPVVADADSAVTVAVSGLPSGLKFTAKPVTSKVTSTVDGRRVTTVVTNVPAMTIYGTPTAASKVNRYGTVTPSQVKVTVTTAGKNKVVSTLALTVDALPTALVGTYTGGATNEPIGSATVTLATTGKVSGKWISEGLTWTIAAANLSGYDRETKTATAMVTFKTGKLVETAELTFAINELGFGTVRAALDDESGAAGVRARPLFDATSVPWKTDSELKSLALQLKNKTFVYNDPAQGATLTGKVGANGTVSVVGEFDVGAAKPYKATVSATLVPVDEDSTIFELFVYYPPVKNKFDGYAAKFLLTWDAD